MDIAKEKKIGLGRDWQLPPLAEGELYLSGHLADLLNVEPGDKIVIG